MSKELPVELVDAARDALPDWAPLLPLALVPIAFVAGSSITWLALWIVLRPLWRCESAAWWERARLAFPRLGLFVLCPSVLPALFAFCVIGFDWSVAAVPGGVIAVGSFVAFALGALLVVLHIDGQVRERRVTLVRWLVDAAVYLIVWIPHVVILLILSAVLPREPSLGGFVVFGLGVAVVVLCLRGDALVLLRWIGLARRAGDRARAVVDAAAQRTGVVPRAVDEVAWSSLNAFAFPLGRRIGFTRPLLEALDDGELVAICAHEMAHLREPRSALVARALAACTVLVLGWWRAIVTAWGLPGFLVALFAVAMVSILVVRLVARPMEERADDVGREHEADPGVYARALQKLYRGNLFPAVTRRKRPMHPHLWDRLVAAGVQPSFDRPPPPPVWRVRVVAVAAIVATLLAPVAPVFSALLAAVWFHDEPALAIEFVLGGGHAGTARSLARLHAGEARLDEADAFYRYAIRRIELDGRADEPWYARTVAEWERLRELRREREAETGKETETERP